MKLIIMTPREKILNYEFQEIKERMQTLENELDKMVDILKQLKKSGDLVVYRITKNKMLKIKNLYIQLQFDSLNIRRDLLEERKISGAPISVIEETEKLLNRLEYEIKLYDEVGNSNDAISQ